MADRLARLPLSETNVTKASLRTLLPMLVSYLGSGGSMLVSAAVAL